MTHKIPMPFAPSHVLAFIHAFSRPAVSVEQVGELHVCLLPALLHPSSALVSTGIFMSKEWLLLLTYVKGLGEK
jgi:hypothetical protein